MNSLKSNVDSQFVYKLHTAKDGVLINLFTYKKASEVINYE